MSKLTSLSLDMGPAESDGIVWDNFTIVHPTLTTITFTVRSYLKTSYEIFKYMPKIKRVNLNNK